MANVNEDGSFIDPKDEADPIDPADESEADLENADPSPDTDPENSDPEKDKGKRKESDEDRLARHERQAARLRKKLGKDSDPKGDDSKPQNKSKEFGYGEKAFLVAKGIQSKDEVALVQEVMAESGKSLEDVLDSKYFQSTLRDHRADRDAEAAVPRGTRRSSQSSPRDTAEYWVDKAELPKDKALATKVVNLRMAKAKAGNMFTDQGVVK